MNTKQLIKAACKNHGIKIEQAPVNMVPSEVGLCHNKNMNSVLISEADLESLVTFARFVGQGEGYKDCKSIHKEFKDNKAKCKFRGPICKPVNESTCEVCSNGDMRWSCENLKVKHALLVSKKRKKK